MHHLLRSRCTLLIVRVHLAQLQPPGFMRLDFQARIIGLSVMVQKDQRKRLPKRTGEQ